MAGTSQRPVQVDPPRLKRQVVDDLVREHR
jgi:hypothetical protein